jgi:predicted permease
MRVYRFLLYLYPAAFRAEYGEELRQLFAERQREATSWPARMLLWLNVLADLLASVMQTHWDIARQDIRYAARMLARSPGYTATAIIVAALGIGANTAVFSVADHVLLRPLPFPDASRLVNVWEDRTIRGSPQLEPSAANFRDWKRRATAVEHMAAHISYGANLLGEGSPERVAGIGVTGELFELLGVRPLIGRLITPEDDTPEAPATIVLSHRFWMQRFAADPNILGRTLTLDHVKYTVIGVMPPHFLYPSRDTMYWLALRMTEQDFAARDGHYFHVIGRLRRSVSLDQARAELRNIAAQLEREYPRENAQAGVIINDLRDEISPRTRQLLIARAGAAIAGLLIACANLANLLLARALVRRKEIALRTVLGAGRERLVRQVLTESLMLTGAGGMLGVLLGIVGVPLLVRLVPNSLPIAEAPPLDLRVLALGALLSALVDIGFGVLPAVTTGRANAAALQEGSRAGIGGRRERLRAMLVVSAIAVVLSITSGLLIRALWRLQAIDPGFRPQQVLTMRTPLPMPQYESTARREQFYDRVLSDIRALPGVTTAGYIGALPLAFKTDISTFPIVLEGEAPDAASTRRASLRFLTPGYFAAMGIPLRRGRDITDSDTADAPRVAIVSESFARVFWPNQDPIGRSFTVAQDTRTVVGVVGNVRVRGIESPSEPQVYLPSRQMPDGYLVYYAPRDLAILSRLPAESLTPAVREIVARADPAQPVSNVRLLTDILDEETAPRTAQINVLGAFTAVALLLAGIGIHGLLSFAVSQRAPEIGVRMAMGAEPGNILRMVLGESLVLSGAGIAIGVALAYAAARAMEALLAGISPRDPASFAAAIGVALAMTLLGCALPAWRAVRIDPMIVMRSE